MIQGGVEVSDEDTRTATGRGQRRQLTAPPGRGARGPGRPRRHRVYAGQLHGLPGRNVKPGDAPSCRGRRSQRLAAQGITGVNAVLRAARSRLGLPVRKQITKPGPLEPDCRFVGELLHEQHLHAQTAYQLDDYLGHSPAGQQVGRQDPQHRPCRRRLAIRYRARAHRCGQGCPGCRGHGSRARIAQQQRAGPRSRGYLRGERQQGHSPRFGEPETISARQPGSSPASQRAGHHPFRSSRRHWPMIADHRQRAPKWTTRSIAPLAQVGVGDVVAAHLGFLGPRWQGRCGGTCHAHPFGLRNGQPGTRGRWRAGPACPAAWRHAPRGRAVTVPTG